MSTANFHPLDAAQTWPLSTLPCAAPPLLLHEVFDRAAAAWPRQVAIDCAGHQLSYGELSRRTLQLARELQGQGVKRGDHVALLLPRSIDRYVALLAILKCGAAYVPLDPDYPAERITFILDDCQARAVVTVAALVDKSAGFTGAVVSLDVAAESIARHNSAPLDREHSAQPHDLAYIIYTSGTTGRPKGVAIEHRSAVHFVLAEQRVFAVGRSDRVYQGFSIAFDASVEEIWLAFAAGATLVVGTDDMIHAGAGLSRMLTEARVTVLSCVPTLLAMLEDDLPTVRLLILGGEVCPQHLVARWCSPSRRMVNTYGPTEATVVATYADCDPDQPVTIGQPLDGYFVCLLDAAGQPAPLGEPGELHIGGPGLARGYVGRPDLTHEKFIATPQPVPDALTGEIASELSGVLPPRLYKTGDLARRTLRGDLEFLGRIDGQVKLRGFRIELGEIESALLDDPEVLAACATVREDTPGVQQLVAYLVARGDEPVDADALRAALRKRLPTYMVPGIFETVAGLPTLPSGKVDRKQLPRPRWQPATRSRDQRQPATPLEARLAACWQALFAPNAVGLEDDFFLELGGHSLVGRPHGQRVAPRAAVRSAVDAGCLQPSDDRGPGRVFAKFKRRPIHPRRRNAGRCRCNDGTGVSSASRG